MKYLNLINDKIITIFITSMVTIISCFLFLSHVDKSKLVTFQINIIQLRHDQNQMPDLIEGNLKEDYLTKRVEVYSGLTLNELSEKLNKSMKGILSDKGYLLASYTLEKGVDPYLALSIILLESGCNYKCSTLTTQCFNVGGMKGSPGCWGGSYKAFSSIDDGIKSFVDNLARNYYARGLTTPEAMNGRYAESNTWAMKVRNYMSSIAAK